MDLRSYMRRYGLGLGCLAFVAGFALLHAASPHAYEFFTRVPDGSAKFHPFIDLRSILQGGVCWRAGVDVYRPSPCLGGVFNYSPLLLRIALLPIGPADTLTGGLLFCAAFALALAGLPAPRDWRAWRVYAAAAFSPVSYYALEQGNLDVLIFALTVLALRLPWRGAAYAIFAAGAAAKFYPAALFILALRENRRRVLLLACAGSAALAVAAAFYGHDLVSAVVQLPSGTPFRASFGRIDFTRGLAMLHMLPHGSAQAGGWALALLALGIAALRQGFWRSALTSLAEAEKSFLIAGAAVISFCFLTAQNIEYRGIFLLLALPGLMRLNLRALPCIILLLLWEAVPRAMLAGLIQPYFPSPLTFTFWLLRETLWWWLIVEFLAIALAFTRQEFRRLRAQN